MRQSPTITPIKKAGDAAIIPALLLILFFTWHLSNNPGCDDFLERWGMKPAQLTFEGCEQVKQAPAVLAEASYTVDGADYKAVEDLLHEQFGMQRLRFVCCGWETRQATYRHSDGKVYSVNMHSLGEFAVNEFNIDLYRFQVSIGKYIVEP